LINACPCAASFLHRCLSPPLPLLAADAIATVSTTTNRCTLHCLCFNRCSP
jgi:hypothetical protein